MGGRLMATAKLWTLYTLIVFVMAWVTYTLATALTTWLAGTIY
jgi:hypothetical protein